MPQPCTGVFNYGNRAFHCWDPHGHGDLSLAGAIEKSCDVYFYQLGLKVGLERLIAGGLKLGFRDKSGIDLPDEQRGEFPYEPVKEYYDNKYGPRNWNQSFVLSLAIGQGENAQTVASMARFYTALATDGASAQPEIAQGRATRTPILTLTADQEAGLRKALANVVSDRGTASASQIQGIVLAGKTGTAQNAQDPNRNHAWFVGFAPADDPKIVVAVMLEFGGHGTRAARVASHIIEHYLKTRPLQLINTDG
jgi:penicillin-binding protein 2